MFELLLKSGPLSADNSVVANVFGADRQSWVPAQGPVTDLNSDAWSESELEQIAESIPHIVWIASPDGVTTYLNGEGGGYTGYQADVHPEWGWVDFLHPDEVGCARKAWADAVGAGTPYVLDHRIRRFDGDYRWHSFRAKPVRDASGSVRSWIGTATDVEDRKQLELALLRSERRTVETTAVLRTIEANPDVGFKFVDRDLRVRYMNGALARFDGQSVDDSLGRTVPVLMPDLWPQLEDVYRRALAGEEARHIDVTGQADDEPERTRHWLCTFYPVRVDGEVIGVGNAVVDITVRREAEQALERNLSAMVTTIATAVEYRDPYTAGHQRRVAGLAAAIAGELDLDASTVAGIETAAHIHDIGKISVPGEILGKPGRLTETEYALMKEHAEAGFHIVSGIAFPWPVAEMIHQHHERMDGSGYPLGLRGSEILLGARIIAVADVVEAMATFRPYRQEQGMQAALDQIQADRGQLLDTDAVAACIRLLRNGRYVLIPATTSMSMASLAGGSS